MQRKYTIDDVKKAAPKCRSWRQLLIALKLSDQGGSYQTIQKFCNRNEIDCSHFTSQGWSKNIVRGIRTSTDSYLRNEMPIGSFRLKNRLIKDNLLDLICSECKNTQWLNKPIPLELDHIDGNSDNNRLENLRLLCPNCHALTPTYRGKNQRRRKV